MTAAEAREAARWHREGSESAARGASRSPYGPARDFLAINAEHHRRASVALDAYAAGIDAAAREREACAGLADRTEAQWREQERTSGDDFTRTRCFARADVAATLARAIRARGADGR